MIRNHKIGAPSTFYLMRLSPFDRPSNLAAIHGYTEIPLEWRAGLKDYERMGQVYEDLVVQAMQLKL